MIRYLALPHDWRITVAYGENDITWIWICKLHKWRCEVKPEPFMVKPVIRERQLKLT